MNNDEAPGTRVPNREWNQRRTLERERAAKENGEESRLPFFSPRGVVLRGGIKQLARGRAVPVLKREGGEELSGGLFVGRVLVDGERVESDER